MDTGLKNPKIFTGDWERFKFDDNILNLSRCATFSPSSTASKISSRLDISSPKYSNANHVVSISSSRDIDDNILKLDKDFLMKHAVNASSIKIERRVASPNSDHNIDRDSITLNVDSGKVVLVREMVSRKRYVDRKISKIITMTWTNGQFYPPDTHEDMVYFDDLDRPIRSIQTRIVKTPRTKEEPNPKDSTVTIEKTSEYFDNIRRTKTVCRLDGFEKFSEDDIIIANDDGIICQYDSGVLPIYPSSIGFTLRRFGEKKIIIGGETINVRNIQYGFDELTVEDIATLCTIINPEFNNYIKYQNILSNDLAGISLEEDK